MPHSAGQQAQSPNRDLQPGINATTARRYAVLLAIKLKRLFDKQPGPVLFLTKNMCVKYGRRVSLREASTIRFVAEKTSIPVPRIYCAFEHRGRRYIVMERLHGKSIGIGWFKRSEESRAKILAQLKDMVDEMRRIKPPDGTGVAHIDGGSLYDERIFGPTLSFGPFDTVQDFHRHLRGGLEASPRNMPEIKTLISQQEAIPPVTVFTHGDLSSLNILARGDEVVGIVDWETAGWYPPYWEYSTAWNANPQNQFWKDEVDKFLDIAPETLEMEKIRIKWFSAV